MKRFLLIFSFLITLCLSAKSQSATYNIVQTSYVNTTIAQTVVFNDTMKAGGTFTFSVSAHNGGGNANTDDTANVKILFYNGGSLVSTAATNYSRNLPIPTGVHGVDPNVPWSTLSISSTNCGGSCANITHAVVQMVGIDGSYWAGDYGPYYRQPTFTVNGGSNILYNPEFGTAPNGTLVQGWTSSASWGTCQGAYGGSNACSTNYSGVTANMNGGGYIATGGTTSGPSGGTTQVVAPVPTAIYTNSSNVYVTRAIPTSTNSPSNEGPANAFDNNPGTKYLNFDKQNAGVTVQLNVGRVVTSFKLTTANDAVERDPTSYKLYGSNDGSTWTLIQEGSLSLSDSRFTVSDGISVTNSTAYVYYFMIFPTIKNNAGNSVQIAEITYFYDANNTTTSTATGSNVVDPTTAAANTLCCGASANQFNGNAVYVNSVILFANRPSNDSKAYVNQIGDYNTITIDQSGTKNNYIKYEGNGNNNTVSVLQTSTDVNATNYVDIKVGTTLSSSNNQINVQQTSTGGAKGAFINVQNNNNSILLKQQDNGNHWAEVSVSGGNKSVDITQQGSGTHMASVQLTGTQPASLVLQQAGSTSQYYSIQSNCTTPGGCAPITVTQGR